ncbi:TetR/AcrR family transcriptional regulator [Nocardia sp. BMG51109]|uniref:TetR/AcrR family transcriptional regulator n=1 Tax=Nocardia sp. BMG51109 TaxID=1056816 RepID=UPI0018DC0F84|nr:TetR/AcrR family transcriptional regulator [Nocardia sp. BMG51109]
MALTEFARGGLHGTATQVIADRAGISQPYLFRLFPTKHAIFCATIEYCFDHIERELREAAGSLEGVEALNAIRDRYWMLLKDTALLQFQLHVFALSVEDTVVRDRGRARLAGLWRLFSEADEDPELVFTFFSRGLLANLMVAFEIPYQHGGDLALALRDWADRS